MRATDCLIIGFNASNFEEYVKMVRAMGEDSGAFKDLDLAFIDYAGKPQHSLDILNHFYGAGRDVPHQPFHNADFIWPVVLYLGSFLARRGFSFDYVNLFQQQQAELRAKLRNDEILTIAITTTLYVSPEPILEIISFIRQHNTRAQIIVGGPYISNQFKTMEPAAAQALFRYLGADIYVTCQEGELTLTNVLRSLKQGLPLEFVDNIAWRRGSDFVITQSVPESNGLAETMVDYSLFPREQIGQFISTRTAKSCPFACAFCGFPQRAGKYTYTPLECVERELNAIAELGTVTTLTFLDDTFNVPKGRFKDIMRMMIRNNYGFHWNSFYRSDQGDDEAIELMRQAGCEGVFLGAESGSDTMLQHMNKTSRRRDYLHAIARFRDVGISTYTSLIVGFPGETYQTVEETIDFVEEARPDFFRAQLWYCDPMTPIWQKREQYGISGLAFNWAHKTMDSRTACDLIDRMFLSVEHATWLPQFGFEQWSTFYLQRRGMSLPQIKTFLRSFNTAIKEKIVYPGKRAVDPGIVECLRVSSQFDRPQPLDPQPLERLAPGGYRAAERFWPAQFRGALPADNVAVLHERAADEPGQGSSVQPLDAAALVRLAAAAAVEQPAALLAALSLLLARLNGRQDSTLIACVPVDGAARTLPLRLLCDDAQSFSALAQTVQRTLRAAAEHQRYGLHIVGNASRMDQYGCAAPRFDLAFSYHALQTPGAALDDLLRFYPAVARGIELTIEAEQTDAALLLRASYDQQRFMRTTIDEFQRYLAAIIVAASAAPDASLRTIAAEHSADPLDAQINDDASEIFNF